MSDVRPAPSSPRARVPLDGAFSLYLDLVRVSAALLVVYVHTNVRVLITRELPADWLGHSAVVVFFVLSGFVIAFVTDTKEKTASDYAASRIARIYSVAVPALVFAALADAFGEWLYPGAYAGGVGSHGAALLRIALCLLMVNESWGLSVQPFTNGPYWSIAYEGWYYILFGMVAFTTGWRRMLLLIAGAALCGPKILLLLPTWLLGVYLYRSRFWRELPEPVGVGLFVGSVILLIAVHAARIDVLGTEWLKGIFGADLVDNRMTFANRFLSDYVIGVLVFLNFAGFRAASATLGRPLLSCARVIREAAVFTFALYLFHRPLIFLSVAVLRGNPSRPAFYFAVVAIVLTACVLFGVVTERIRKRLRPRIAAYLRSTEATLDGVFKRAVAGV